MKDHHDLADRLRSYILDECGGKEVTDLRLTSANATSFKTRGINGQRLEVIVIDTREDGEGEEPGV